MSTRPFTEENRAWFISTASAVRAHFAALFESNSERFPSADRLLAKYDEAVAAVLSYGWNQFERVVDFHNELALAELILNSATRAVRTLEYEAVLPGIQKTVDFRLVLEDGSVILIDVKTVRPQMVDRWPKYEEALARGLLAPGTEIELHEAWLGGELWHLKVASRERFLEHSVALEAKIRDSKSSPGTTVVLALFSTGFHWHLDELEDFVAFYKTGQHASFDPFGKMEVHHMAENAIHLDRAINGFAFFKRAPESLSVDSGTWNVEPPRLPF